MTFDWRPGRLHPERVHLFAADGRARCGAQVAAPFVRCAVYVLLAEGVGAPAWIPIRIVHDREDEPAPPHLGALGSPDLDVDHLAHRAADALAPLGVLLTDVHLELAHALRSIPEPSRSRRAGLVRHQLREALVALEVTAAAYAQAEETLRAS
ncbi:hypothetical protein [Amycolatopsis sp. NPDC051128]|uniref:hypothetical protein n=1 Tax=Amycolatopsis sp. NPDC051128 TaxID=3155412 RepID=UPI0034197664